jgi:RNA polymerase sigma factor (sigma-70 family)
VIREHHLARLEKVNNCTGFKQKIQPHLVEWMYREVLHTHGNIAVVPTALEEHVALVATKYLHACASDEELTAFVKGLHVSDIGLCLACGSRCEFAWRHFKDLHRSYLVEICRFVAKRRMDAEDFVEGLVSYLFLPDRSGRSRILSYDGRSSLSTWLRVIACNKIFNERQAKWSGALSLDSVPQLAVAMPVTLDQALSASRYTPAIQGALRKAIQELSPHERLMILWRFEQNLQLGQIARLMNVHQSTVTRQMDKALFRVRTHFASLLASEYGLSGAAVAECIDVAKDGFSIDESILVLIRRADCKAMATEREVRNSITRTDSVRPLAATCGH